MKLTKEVVRKAWAKEPGFRAYHVMQTELVEDRNVYPHCARFALPSEALITVDFYEVLTTLNDEALHPELGVTPEERRDCMIAMLLAGAFDAWLDS